VFQAQSPATGSLGLAPYESFIPPPLAGKAMISIFILRDVAFLLHAASFKMEIFEKCLSQTILATTPEQRRAARPVWR
jgi:hypothetical protein